MSEYVYRCESCNREFTHTQHMSDHDREKSGVTCPHCGSDRVQQMLTAFSTVTSKKS